jgi:hypothetical protein
VAVVHRTLRAAFLCSSLSGSEQVLAVLHLQWIMADAWG